MMAVHACHVIYEIRITRHYFKGNPEPGQTKHRVEGIFFITTVRMFTCYSLACLIISCSAFLESALNLLQVCLLDPNILSPQRSVLLPTVGNIYNFQHIFPRYDLICQTMNAFLSAFVFPAFSSPHLCLSGVTTGLEGKYLSLSYSLMPPHCTSIHTLYLNPSPHICPIF